VSKKKGYSVQKEVVAMTSKKKKAGSRKPLGGRTCGGCGWPGRGASGDFKKENFFTVLGSRRSPWRKVCGGEEETSGGTKVEGKSGRMGKEYVGEPYLLEEELPEEWIQRKGGDNTL